MLRKLSLSEFRSELFIIVALSIFPTFPYFSPTRVVPPPHPVPSISAFFSILVISFYYTIIYYTRVMLGYVGGYVPERRRRFNIIF